MHDCNYCRFLNVSDPITSICQILEGIRKWPLLQRNKIDDSKIEKPIRKLVEDSPNEKLRDTAREVCSGFAYNFFMTQP